MQMRANSVLKPLVLVLLLDLCSLIILPLPLGLLLQDPCTNNYLYHKCDTVQGQSGSAMWQMMLMPDLRIGPYIRAVHNLEWASTNSTGVSTVYINSGVAITPEHYSTIMKWIAPSFVGNVSAVSFQVASFPYVS